MVQAIHSVLCLQSVLVNPVFQYLLLVLELQVYLQDLLAQKDQQDLPVLHHLWDQENLLVQLVRLVLVVQHLPVVQIVLWLPVIP